MCQTMTGRHAGRARPTAWRSHLAHDICSPAARCKYDAAHWAGMCKSSVWHAPDELERAREPPALAAAVHDGLVERAIFTVTQRVIKRDHPYVPHHSKPRRTRRRPPPPRRRPAPSTGACARGARRAERWARRPYFSAVKGGNPYAGYSTTTRFVVREPSAVVFIDGPFLMRHFSRRRAEAKGDRRVICDL